MENPSTLESLDAVIAALGSIGAGLEVAGATSAALTAMNDRVGRVRRLVDAVQARVAGEIARQSRPELGRDSLARKQGFRTPQTMIAATAGVSAADAQRILQVAEATAPRANLVGERLPAKHPHVATGVESGALGMASASAIVQMLDRVALRVGADRMLAMEKALVEAAPGLRPDEVTKLILRAEAYIDPDGQEPRDRANRDARSLVIREDADGMIVITARLDAASAAPVKAALEGMVTQRFRAGAHGAEPGDDADHDGGGHGDARRDDETPAAGTEDPRGVKAMLADALVTICTHALGCREVPTGSVTTVVVRMDAEALETGVGIAQIDGIAAPVSAETARRMAVDAGVIPCVLGGDGAILDWGRTRRLFTPEQKLALVERDGGCAFCGAPPGQANVHHIRWWERDRGPTDLANGVLLCVGCHHRVHEDGWEIRIAGPGVDEPVWFVPPVFIDRARVPRRGGASRYRLAG